VSAVALAPALLVPARRAEPRPPMESDVRPERPGSEHPVAKINSTRAARRTAV
jgi:hypothetical protein